MVFVALKQRVEAQLKNLIHVENTRKGLRSRIYSLTKKGGMLGKK